VQLPLSAPLPPPLTLTNGRQVKSDFIFLFKQCCPTFYVAVWATDNVQKTYSEKASFWTVLTYIYFLFKTTLSPENPSRK
jgi:hypothetical protein